MWHCPHCGAPQAETARCWVCRRSSTTCSTCRNFRASLATDLNYCALDRRRRLLTGLELRGCWEERPSSLGATAQLAGGGAAGDRSTARAFVPVEEVRPRRQAEPAEPAQQRTAETPVELDLPFVVLEPVEGWERRTSLFGEPER